jgi:uncharacterized protein YcbK (DUF882 family)
MDDTTEHGFSRRRLAGALIALLAAVIASPSRVSAAEPCELRFHHTHTGEHLTIVHRSADGYVPEALDELSRFLADFRTGDRMPMDPKLFDILCAIQESTGSDGTWEVISAYRSPATNAQLRAHSTGVAEHSLHMSGKAIDVRLTDVRLEDLRDAAWSLQQGGVGYYPASDFVHIDTGRARRW